MTPLRQSQFTPKMKANAVLHLLSSLVWIDQYNECNGITIFMEFMMSRPFFVVFQLRSFIASSSWQNFAASWLFYIDRTVSGQVILYIHPRVQGCPFLSLDGGDKVPQIGMVSTAEALTASALAFWVAVLRCTKMHGEQLTCMSNLSA